MSSFVNFSMNNPQLFTELEKIGIVFSNNGKECKLPNGLESEFVFEDGMSLPGACFEPASMIGRFLDHFLGTCTGEFSYEFIKTLSAHGYIDSKYNFDENPCDDDFYLEELEGEFTLTEKLLKYDETIIEAVVESADVEFPDIRASRITVNGNNMVINDIDFCVDEDFDIFYDAVDFDTVWNILDDEGKPEFTYKKTLQNGKWVGDSCDLWR